MIAFLTVLHVFISVFLIISILLQSSKGGGLAGMFGGGGMGQVMGSRGAASFLSKVTLWLGIGFGVTSVSIALLSKGTAARQRSLLQQAAESEGVTTPASVLPTVPGDIQESTPARPPQPEEKQE